MAEPSHPFVRVSAYGLLVRDGRVLLCRLANLGNDNGKWTLPGGGIEFGEAPQVAIKRELAEETGLTVEPLRLVTALTATFRRQRVPMQAVRLLYTVRVTAGEVRPESDGTTDECRWVPLKELDRYPLVDLVRDARPFMQEADLIDDALQWAAARHAGQRRDGSDLPYLSHPVEVLANLVQIGGVQDEAMRIAAILHDVIEETHATREEIARRYGDEVADLVQELTRREPTAKERAGKSRAEIYGLRNQWLQDEIRRMSPRAQTIKLADRLANYRESEITRTGEKRDRYRHQTRQILQIIPESVNPPLWQTLNSEPTLQIE